MNTVLRHALGGGLSINERLLAIADNAFDWLFLRETLVKSGLTFYETIYEGDPMTVRYYPRPLDPTITLDGGETLEVQAERHAVPLVLVPPLGVTTEVFDLMPHRSLARYFAARGFDVYLIDWGKPERRHGQLGMKDYAQDMFATALAEIRRHSGVKTLSLMGWCMGGLLSLLYLGLTRDKDVRNLITIASPIDMRGGGIVARTATALNRPAQLIRKFTGWRLHNLDPSRLNSPGWLTTLSFKLTDPIGSVTTYWDLLTRLWDREFVENHSTTADYLNNMLLYPGGVIQDMVIKLAVDNQMAAGRIDVRGAIADLTAIKANFLVFAGENDKLVPASIARRSLELVKSKDKDFHVVPGGHMGVILGSKAVGAVWARSAEWLAERSAPPKTKATPKRSSTGAEKTLRDARRRRQAADLRL